MTLTPLPAGGAGLRFGALDLKVSEPTFGILDPGKPWIAALGEGMDPGNPEAIVAAVASMLTDGDNAEVTRYGNQLARFPLRITGENLDVVADGEALVMAEVNKGRNTITWTPPGPAEPNVHDVVYGKLEFHFDDWEERQVSRYFTLVLECLPFARRVERTVVVAEPVPSPSMPQVWQTIDDCSSTTGWATGIGGDSPYPVPDFGASGGRIWVATPPEPYPIYLTRFGLSAPIAAGEYLTLDFVAANPYPGGPYGFDELGVSVNGGPRYRLRDCAAIAPIGPGRARYYWRIPSAVTVNSLDISLLASAPRNGPIVELYDVSKVDKPPLLGSRSQRSFTVGIGGTARTQADIVLETTAGTTMGRELMVYTAPSGKAMQPPLRKWKTSGGTDTTDVTAMSGYSTPLNVQVGISFPVPQPGMHRLYGRLRATSGTPTVTVNWSSSNAIRSYGGALDSGATQVTLSTAWRLVPLAMLMLPTTAVPEGSTTIQEMNVSTPSSGVLWDDFYVCNLDAGDLTIFADMLAGTALPTRAVIRSASLDSPRPAWLLGTRGTAADDVDVSSRMASPGVHSIDPGPMDVFVMSADGDVGVRVEAYDRFMHNVTKRPVA